MGGVHDWLPDFDVSERHETTVPASPEEALRELLSTPVAPDRFVRALLRLRGLQADESLEAFFASHGFLLLERTATSYVVGFVAGSGRERVTDSASWLAARRPGSIKVAADFRSEAMESGSRLTTETRVRAIGRMASVVFRLYWFVIGPFSALIRRRWLRAVRARFG